MRTDRQESVLGRPARAPWALELGAHDDGGGMPAGFSVSGVALPEPGPARDGILATIGNTPLVRLRRALGGVPFRLYAKLEAFNPGGSIKDRPAVRIVADALAVGEIDAGTTVVEASSGNMGIGLAQVCAYHGLRFVCVVDNRTTAQNIHILQAYGAVVDVVTEPDPETGDLLQAKLDRVRRYLETEPSCFWPNQYANRNNSRSHHRTMAEIVHQAGGRVDYLFCATATCGTLRGCAEYVREMGLPTRIVAVDAVGSVIFGGRSCKRLIPGHGTARVPELHDPALGDRFVQVTDRDCVAGCRRLLREEAILAGGSSGGILMGLDALRHEIEPDATCVLVFPDRGERYLDTIFSDVWVAEHFGAAQLEAFLPPQPTR
ncbi:MAG: Cysteine synthase [Gemmatimonadetes bacterium]|nr:Cysteine synthase [Gemmatimonadota bacterium]